MTTIAASPDEVEVLGIDLEKGTSELVRILRSGSQEELNDLWKYFDHIKNDPFREPLCSFGWKYSDGYLIKKTHDYYITYTDNGGKVIVIRCGEDEVQIIYNNTHPTTYPTKIIMNSFTLSAMALNVEVFVQNTATGPERFLMKDIIKDWKGIK